MTSIDTIINELDKILRGKSLSEIINLEQDNIYNKSAVSHIIKNHISKKFIYGINTILKYNIKIKTVPVNEQYECHEAMSFSNISLYNILFEKWDSKDEFEVAELHKKLQSNYLLIPIIKIKANGKYNNYLNWTIGQFSLWTPSNHDLIEIGKEWNDVQKILREGLIIKKVKHGNSYRNLNNLPKQSQTNYIHLRPHGKNKYDYDKKYLEFTEGKIEITKQSFWLNKKFINSLIKTNKWIMNSREK